MILLAGDSWACGEWTEYDHEPKIKDFPTGLFQGRWWQNTHPGLAFYLEQDGHSVINLGQGGSSNRITVERLRYSLDICKKFNHQIDSIFVFQTEWSRDFNFFPGNPSSQSLLNVNIPDHIIFGAAGHDMNPADNFLEKFNITGPRQLGQCLSNYFYKQLSALCQQYNVSINLIGGCAETNSSVDFPGLNIACQSVTNLLINQDSTIALPIQDMYKHMPRHNKFNGDRNITVDSNPDSWCASKFYNNREELIEMFDLATQRHILWSKYPELFWPDGIHANRAGHKILHEFLKQQQLV